MYMLAVDFVTDGLTLGRQFIAVQQFASHFIVGETKGATPEVVEF